MMIAPGVNYKALLPPTTSATNGCGTVPEKEVCEAIGAYLLIKSGYNIEGSLAPTKYEEANEFTYCGRVWRVTIVKIYDMQIKQAVPFRIDFDYIKEATDE